MVLRFPEHFFWGSSTSAAQIETASDHNWKGLRARDGYLFERTTDHEKRREEDAGYISRFGTIYRCSVDWARLQGKPFGAFNPDVIKEYQDFFKLLEQRGTKIMFVLYHFAHPLWFDKTGGWLSEQNINAFIDFSRQCIQHFGKWVVNWNTFNEPNVYAMSAYFLGKFPPMHRKYREANIVLRNMGKAHDVVYDMLKLEYPEVPVGISLNTAFFEGLNWLGKLPAGFSDWWFHKKAARPFRKVDYWGLSYYAYVPFTPFPITNLEKPQKMTALKIPHDNMWGYRPEGLGMMLRRFYRKYKKPVIITENGICTDEVSERIQSIKTYLKICHQAIEEGVDLRGFIYWSTFDNFEWYLGPSYRFGLVRVNLFTKDRTLTEAAEFYARICSENAVDVN